jgi:hypothetical protein
MAAWTVLLLVLLIDARLISASAATEWNLKPEELARLKQSGVTESVIHSRVEKVQLFLAEKHHQVQRFVFFPKVIPSADMTQGGWSVASRSEVLLTFHDSGGYLSTKTRAEVVARQLNHALEIGGGKFSSIQHNGKSAVLFQTATDRLVIASASERDAAFFEVSANLIAEKWAAVLNRFWQSLPGVLLQPLPDALTLPDLVWLSEAGLANRTLLSFLHLREIDRAVKAEQVKQLGFSKEVSQYLTKRLAIEPADGSRRWRSFGSYDHCGKPTISISATVSFGRSGGIHVSGQQRGTGSSQMRSSRVKSSHAGLPGRNASRSRSQK